MHNRLRFIVAAACALLMLGPAASFAHAITVNGNDTGRVYEGIGTLSAGASTRLLQDYATTQKAQILDYVFCNPNVSSTTCTTSGVYGAGFQHLKVEIGGDTNSTDGSEPAFLRTRAEFDALNSGGANATTCHFSRGYEWGLLSAAKLRNPSVILDALAWGFPGWINDTSPYAGTSNIFMNWKRFFEPIPPATVSEAVTYLVDFVKCAAANGTALKHIGVWNEADFLTQYPDPDPNLNWDQTWVNIARQFHVDLRNALNAAGYSTVKIVGHDGGAWEPIVTYLTAPTPGNCNSFPAGLDRDFCNAIGSIGSHYAWQSDPTSTTAAQNVGKPLWLSEDTPGRYDAPFSSDHTLRTAWLGARDQAQHLNWVYIDGRVVKTEYWSPISGYYGELPYADGGVVRAREPWSNHYVVTTMLWVLAHTAQFALPTTWRYISNASCYFGTASCTTRSGNTGSYVVLRPTAGTSNVNWSLVIETVNAVSTQTKQYCMTGGLKSSGTVRVYLTNTSNNFVRQADKTFSGGCFTLTLAPDSLYTATTLTTAVKGNAGTPPASQAFPFPYSEDFESYSLGVTPKYLSDQQGTFEVGCGVGESKCLEQKVLAAPIPWQSAITTQTATLIGDPYWTNYEVKIGLNAPNPDSNGAAVWGRVHTKDADLSEPGRYQISILNNGNSTFSWYLYSVADGGGVLREQSAVRSYITEPWVNVTLRMNGSTITAIVDGVTVATWTDTSWTQGQVALGDAYGGSKFDVLCIQAVSGSSC